MQPLFEVGLSNDYVDPNLMLWLHLSGFKKS